MTEPKFDAEAMGKLAKSLTFICGADHPCVKALAKAAESKAEKDIKAARTQFLKLKHGERQAALTMLSSDD
jgi:hypothetical protein